MYFYLVSLLFISLYGSDSNEAYSVALDTSYNRLISIDTSKINIDTDDQLRLPVDRGQYINILLDGRDLLAYDSIRNLIKAIKVTNQDYILASYRSRSEGAKASYIQYAEALQLLQWINKAPARTPFTHDEDSKLAYWIKRSKQADLVTRCPIVKIDFHEFCRIDDKLAVRYLGNLNDAFSAKPSVILELHFSNKDECRYMNLAQLHIKHKNGDYCKKYLDAISQDTLKKDWPSILAIVSYALRDDRNDVAIHALNKIAFVHPDPTFLLYKIHDGGDKKFLCELVRIISGSIQNKSYDRLMLGNIYVQEAVKKPSLMGIDFFRIGVEYHKEKAAEGDSDAMYALLRDLSLAPQETHKFFVEQQELREYANRCVDTINSNDKNSVVVHSKRHFLLDYRKTLKVIKTYATKEIVQ